MTARVWFCCCLVITFVVIGYLYSDNRLAQQILATQKINTPQEVFQFVINQKVQAPAGSSVQGGQSFRELMAKDGGLWCDEGSVTVAVLVGQLGYKTRLVDLIGKNSGLSHHTVVQVFEKDQWVTYDFTGRNFGQAPEKTVDYDAIALTRVYPKWNHQLILNNHFLRMAAQKIRPWIKFSDNI